MKSTILRLIVLISTLALVTSDSSEDPTESLQDNKDDSSPTIEVGHGAEAHLARKIDSQVGEEIKKNASEERRRIASFARIRRRLSKRSPFFTDDDFAVFSHSTYDADVDSDSTFYEEKQPANDNQAEAKTSPFASERRRMRRRVARSVGHGPGGGGGAVKATTANRMNGWYSKNGHKAAGHHKGGRRTGPGGHRRTPDTSGWSSCPPCCTWPSSWDTSCRSFYNCFSC